MNYRLSTIDYQLLSRLSTIDCFQDRVQEKPFRQRAFDMRLPIDNGPGDGEDTKLFGEVGEFGGFNAIGADKRAFHGKLVSQAHGRRAMGSGRCGKHLQVERLSELRELLAAFRK